jgi:hypothetical protein
MTSLPRNRASVNLNSPGLEPKSDPLGFLFAPHLPPPLLLLGLAQIHDPCPISTDTCFGQFQPAVIDGLSGVAEDVRFRIVAEQSDLELLDLRGVEEGYSRS